MAFVAGGYEEGSCAVELCFVSFSIALLKDHLEWKTYSILASAAAVHRASRINNEFISDGEALLRPEDNAVEIHSIAVDIGHGIDYAHQ